MPSARCAISPDVVVNIYFNRVVYDGCYDTNIRWPSPIVDFNVADWVINRDKKEINRPSVLTCYVPRPESERSRILVIITFFARASK